MKKKWKKRLAFMMLLSAMTGMSITPAKNVCYAKESVGNGVILSTDAVEIAEGGYTTFTATLPEGFDASRLYCVIENPNVANVMPLTVTGNVATFMIQYTGNGNTVVAVSHYDNPAVVAYMTVVASPIVMDIPEKLGTNKDNYCVLDSYEFVPYDFTYMDFNDYKCTLNLKYKCASYKDDSFKKWGCYAYFYDANGNILEKKHLYCASLSEGRLYHIEFNVPVNAVKFSIEG